MSLSRSLTEAAVQLSRSADSAASATVSYRPTKLAANSFSLVLFPDGPTTREELIDAGLPPAQAERIFHDLAYLEVGTDSTLVLLIPGERLTFTSHWRRHAAVDRILVAADAEECELVLAKGSEGVTITQLRPSRLAVDRPRH